MVCRWIIQWRAVGFRSFYWVVAIRIHICSAIWIDWIHSLSRKTMVDDRIMENQIAQSWCWTNYVIGGAVHFIHLAVGIQL